MTLTAVTMNLGNATDEAVLRDLHRLLATAQIAGLQEAGDRWDVLHDFQMAHPGQWLIWAGTAAGSRSVPMLYRADLGPVRLFSRLAVPRMTVGRGAGPDVAKAKAITGVGVGVVDVLNTHMIASAWQQKSSPLRRTHYRIHVRVLARMMQNRINRGREVLALGDFNCPPDGGPHALLDPLKAVQSLPHAALTQLTQAPTHGTQIYDQGWSSELGTTQVTNTSSDHHAVTFTV